jgi:hypothetical protein
MYISVPTENGSFSEPISKEWRMCTPWKGEW